jgi:hypothetical protein
MNTDRSKIILASYPRSGNTYLRNILSRVYGIASTADGKIKTQINFEASEIRILKTHQHYKKFRQTFNPYLSIYLVRDGRDALVSEAHHRKDIIAPGTPFSKTLKESIFAKRGSYFGGWADNVESWIDPAAIFLRYEDLIEQPITVVEQLRKYIKLASANVERLPTFEDMKKGDEDFVSHQPVLTKEGNLQNRHQLFFRKGVAGGWRQEMDDEQHELFWKYHGHMMQAIGYHKDGTKIPFEEFNDRLATIKKNKPKSKLSIFERWARYF